MDLFQFSFLPRNYLCPSTVQNNATSGFLKRNMDLSTGGKPATEHLEDSRHFKMHKATARTAVPEEQLNLDAVPF